MQHYVITGGAGFIGSNLIRSLLEGEAKIRITCIDNFDPFYARSLKDLNMQSFRNHPRFRLIEADLSTTTAMELANLLADPVDVIIHLAAKAGVRPSILDPEAYQQSNVLGLQHLLNYARDAKVPQFVFASSSSVYGVNENFPWSESETLLPISPYAMTKLAGEMLGHVYHHLYGIRFIGLRFFTVYGPGQRPDLAIHKFTRSILKGQPIPMFGDGNTSRDYTYIDDIVAGIQAAIQYTASGFEIVNIGNHYTVTLSELIGSLETVLNKKAIIEKLPEQPGDLAKTYADITKAGRLFNYHPETQLQQGLQRFADWFMTHEAVLL